jgi:cyclopropane fatty-acyl-phospholipid synthase-like methyltransferase
MTTDTNPVQAASEGFSRIYEAGDAPWDLDVPQPPFVAIADRVRGPLLDAGCGAGTTSVYFAARGLSVTGIDFAEPALRRAREKAASRGVEVTFLRKDAMTLRDWDARFESVIDSGLFHVWHGEQRTTYVEGLAHVLRPGGHLYLFAFSEEETVPERGTSEAELRALFSERFTVESVERARGVLSPGFLAKNPAIYPGGYTKMLFAILQRKSD